MEREVTAAVLRDFKYDRLMTYITTDAVINRDQMFIKSMKISMDQLASDIRSFYTDLHELNVDPHDITKWSRAQKRAREQFLGRVTMLDKKVQLK
jgi:hypothetical protein